MKILIRLRLCQLEISALNEYCIVLYLRSIDLNCLKVELNGSLSPMLSGLHYDLAFACKNLSIIKAYPLSVTAIRLAYMLKKCGISLYL